jgi:trimeric autotransporter adhesin
VYRETPLAEPLVDFTDGATLVAADLDTNAKQSIYIQQELDDGLVDGLVNVIPNGDKGDIITSSNGQVWTIDTGAVTSAKILDGAVVNADINASAGIVDTKLAQITTANKVSGSAITTGNISTTGSITTTSTLSVQGLTFGKGVGAISSNTAAGVNALNTNTTGVNNTAIGAGTLQANTQGESNTAVGFDALNDNTTGIANTAIGRLSLPVNISGDNNTAVGVQTLFLNTIGDDNTAIGLNALYNTTNNDNTAIGAYALSENTTGTSNVAVGRAASFSKITGNNNTTIGTNALSVNTSGANNVGIGYNCSSSTTTISNEVNITNGTVIARYQGAASAWTFVSDVRDKTDIENLTLGLDFIAALKPRKFKWNLRNTEVDRGKPSAGFIAQEVLQTVEAFNAPYTNLVDANDPNQYTFAQANMIPMLVKAIQELAAKVEALENSL